MPFLNKGNITAPTGSNLYMSTGSVVLPTYSFDELNSEIVIGEGIYRTYRDSEDFTGNIIQFSIPETVLAIGNSEIYYVCVNYNNGSPIIYLEDDKSATNDSNILVIYTIFPETGELDVLNWGREAIGLVNKLNERFIDTQRYGRVFGFEISSFNSEVICSGGEFYLGSNKISQDECSSAIDQTELLIKDGLGGWTESEVTAFPNTKYDNGSGILQDLGIGEYGICWVWRSAGTPKELYFILGNESYANLQIAQTGKVPSDRPNKVDLGALFLGRVIFQSGSSVALTESAFRTIFGANSPTSHNALLGLQGGLTGEYYHISNDELTIVQNTSGVNTGDEITGDLTTLSNIIEVANGTNSVIGSGTSLDINEENLTHNNIGFIQGGLSTERYHLDNSELLDLQNLISIMSNYSKMISYSTLPLTVPISSINIYQKIPLSLTSLSNQGFTFDLINNRIVYSGVKTKQFIFNGTATLANGGTPNMLINFKVYKNGAPLDYTLSSAKIESSSDARTIDIASGITLSTNDYIEIWTSADKINSFSVNNFQIQLLEDYGYSFNN